MGLDPRYDFDQGAWVADKDRSYDNVVKRSRDRFIDMVKNVYRVLFSRGMKGCYVYFMDKDTERFSGAGWNDHRLFILLKSQFRRKD